MNEIIELIKRHNNSLLNINKETLDQYINKITENATFITHIEDGKTVAFYAFYVNNEKLDFSFGTMLIVEPDYRRFGIATQLLKYWLDYAKNRGFYTAKLEVNIDNPNSVKMCEKVGFAVSEVKEKIYVLEKIL
jgi:GNAT superfamily N-acetyltransferase